VKPRLAVAKLNLPRVAATTAQPIVDLCTRLRGSPHRGYARVALEMAGRAPIMSGQLVM
jgi:hypothetical protein